MPDPIPVIDLFAGPGGLSEGLSAYRDARGRSPFRIALSIEKDAAAHQTLELRAFYRQFPLGAAPAEYYQYLQAPTSEARYRLYAAHPEAAAAARREAWRAELGVVDEAELDRRIVAALDGQPCWALVGGPPCQAFSIVGRSRRKGIRSDDPRVHLYKEYLRIIAVHRPPVFVMENVTGLLSSKVDGELVFDTMLADLQSPEVVLSAGPRRSTLRYDIRSFVTPWQGASNGTQHTSGEYVIRCDAYGIPQCRQRVILLGVRSDMLPAPIPVLSRTSEQFTAASVLNDLPRLRSGLSREADSSAAWREALKSATTTRWYCALQTPDAADIALAIERRVRDLRIPRADRGADFVRASLSPSMLSGWYHDARLEGACNHATRAHQVSDLHRYLFASVFAERLGRSPSLGDFPRELLPTRKNAQVAWMPIRSRLSHIDSRVGQSKT